MKFAEAGYDVSGKNRMFTINIHSDCRIEEYDYDTIISKVKNEFNARNINALLSRYGNNIVGCFQNVDKTAAVSNAEVMCQITIFQIVVYQRLIQSIYL